MHPIVPALAGLCALIQPALADGYRPITERARFLELMASGALHHPWLDIRLWVSSDGQIKGDALGWPISGTWSWQEGYFCRELDWSGTPIAYNCQLVEETEGPKLRFTVDRGTGEAATFRVK